MARFLVTGDEENTVSKLRELLEGRQVATRIAERNKIRLEAENFHELDGYEVKYVNDRKASHRLSVVLTNGKTARIRTAFDEPYSASGVFDVDVRCYDAPGGHVTFRLFLNRRRQGASWTAAADDGTWRSYTITNAVISIGDKLEIEGQGHGREFAELDFLELRGLNQSFPRESR